MHAFYIQGRDQLYFDINKADGRSNKIFTILVEVGGGCLSSTEENKRLHGVVLRMPCGMRTYELICAFYRTDSNNHSFCADSKNKFISFCHNIRCHQVSFDVSMILMHMFVHNHNQNLELFWKQIFLVAEQLYKHSRVYVCLFFCLYVCHRFFYDFIGQH